MNNLRIQWFVIILLAFLMSGCSTFGSPRIEIMDVDVLEAKVSGLTTGDLNFSCICDIPEVQNTTSVFLTIHNKGGEADRLLKAETSHAVQVDIRRGGNGEDLASAELVEEVEIPAFGKIEFRDGKYWMTLTGIKEDIRPGDVVKIKLFFEKSGPVDFEAVASPR